MRSNFNLLLCVLAAAPAFSQTGSLTITTGSLLPTGTVGVPYSLSFDVSGGAPPYLWGLSGGGLPAGLNLSSDGCLSGTPTTPGTSKLRTDQRHLSVIDGP